MNKVGYLEIHDYLVSTTNKWLTKELKWVIYGIINMNNDMLFNAIREGDYDE